MGFPPKKPRVIRVLVAEDSLTVRTLLVAAFDDDPELAVVGEAGNGLEAVEMTRRLRPDVITMDVRMPGLDGLGATREIMSHTPTPIVIVSDAAREDAVSLALDATAAGALTVRRWLKLPSAAPRMDHSTNAIRLVAIAASTGGPAALREVLGGLASGFGAPIAIVQHIATGFVPGLVRWLSLGTALKVKIAEEGESLASGIAYVAPDDRHLGFDFRGHVALSQA